ncbi:50S ribosomal protein L13 [Candidatus Dependentiae bacterium]|nr:50S ribosomal protein L13 [Candidatus Dependentiae bacterium]
MNRAFFLRKEDTNPQWRVIDADGKVLGRLATELADILRGKDRATFTPHTDSGDYVVVINASKIKLTGNKWKDKEYVTVSGWMGGKKVKSAQEVFDKDPARLIQLAVKRMLPKNILSRAIIKKLKIYSDAVHPHKAQVTAIKM